MKPIRVSLALSLCMFISGPAIRADVTIVQKIEGIGSGEMTIKIKGDKVRVDVSPQITTIFDGKTGETINLMKDQKTVVRISADRMKAAAEMLKKFNPQKESTEKPKLVSTGQKETINGYQTEQYVYEGSDFKATCWVALNYPNGSAILKELQTVKSNMGDPAGAKWPDYSDFPGLPLRTKMTMKRGEGNATSEYTNTIVSVKQDPLSDSDFAVPKDFKEVAMPNVLGRKPASSESPNP